jgi:hypothetical protein
MTPKRKPREKPEEFDDRRQAPRVVVDGRYTVRLDPCDGREAIVCPVLDFSVTGMRLNVPEDVALPSNVQILIGQLSHDARIVWRKDAVIGVDLVDEHYDIIY